MPDETTLLDTIRLALRELSEAERERARAWAWSGSGLLDPAERRGAQMEAEREVEDARQRLQRARLALSGAPVEGRDWGAH